MTSATVTELLRHHLRFGLMLLAGPATDTPIQHVTAADTLAALDRVPAESLIVILGSEPISSYEIDVAIRQAAARDAAGLVFAAVRELPITATRLAERARLPVLGLDDGRDGAELLLDIDRFVRGGASDALARAAAAIRAAQQAAELEGPDAVRLLLDAVSEALGCRLVLDETRPTDQADPGAVVVGRHLVARLVPDLDDDATRVALPAIAALVSRLRQRELNRRFAPALTRAGLIVQLVLCDRAQLPQLVEQAFQLDFPVEQAHVVAWLQVEDAETSSLVRARQVLEEAELSALQVLHARPGAWHVARLGGDLIIVRTGPAGAELHRQVRTEVGRLIDVLTDRGDIVITGGLGTPQTGPDGLRQSAAEARVAADSAHATGRRGALVEADATGLRRILADLYSSPLSRNLLSEMLAPLDALGAARSRVGLTTLSAYLDAQCSPTRAAEVLHLHPNAVAYRLRWITEALGADLTDPDTRFALQMACRVRLLNG
ncbi:helix-turn-helix domain-containing protein [Nonomuraea turcica]|uniref:helix-turn-helix domain-containing protein n=1 Tax=Nonomuraea sp. G32 TaxID=3067274 RepID=UPI00273B0406|nr:helix-turn-helix domain-containing protein [Nonomuraea sp. G32]MDP4501314.1 helix-turn-helix domain-containing protein [Nonomuraea sp. G32]